MSKRPRERHAPRPFALPYSTSRGKSASSLLGVTRAWRPSPAEESGRLPPGGAERDTARSLTGHLYRSSTLTLERRGHYVGSAGGSLALPAATRSSPGWWLMTLMIWMGRTPPTAGGGPRGGGPREVPGLGGPGDTRRPAQDRCRMRGSATAGAPDRVGWQSSPPTRVVPAPGRLRPEGPAGHHCKGAVDACRPALSIIFLLLGHAAALGYQWPRWTTESNGRRFGRAIGASGRSAG
jgi:hypothetical protein